VTPTALIFWRPLLPLLHVFFYNIEMVNQADAVSPAISHPDEEDIVRESKKNKDE
jgi:hypothetical protein